MRTMIGLMPGPDSPPNLLPIAGRNVSVFILSPRIVFDTTSASAPARSAALATATTSPAFGDNFTHIGLLVVARMSFTTLYVCSSCRAKLPPLGSRVGQEILTSSTSIADLATSRAMASKSSIVVAEIEPTSGGARRRIAGAVFARHGLGDERAEPVQIHDLGEVGRETSRGRHDRIFQHHRTDFDAHIYHPTASCMSKTGPSIQTRRNSCLPPTSKVRTQT